MIVPIIQRAVMQGIPLLFGSTGEIITEKSGHLNLGIPGIMYVGAISGVIGAFLYEQNTETLNPMLAVLIPLASSILGSLLMGILYCVLTVTLHANQNVTGLAMTTPQLLLLKQANFSKRLSPLLINSAKQANCFSHTAFLHMQRL